MRELGLDGCTRFPLKLRCNSHRQLQQSLAGHRNDYVHAARERSNRHKVTGRNPVFALSLFRLSLQ